MARADTSLPVPVSPSINTVASVSAARVSSSNKCRIGGEAPTSPPKRIGPSSLGRAGFEPARSRLAGKGPLWQNRRVAFPEGSRDSERPPAHVDAALAENVATQLQLNKSPAPAEPNALPLTAANELTLRALLAGCVLGALLAAANVYTALK